MSQRHEALDSLDDFPTPRWATRALLEHILDAEAVSEASCWEPTCGRGFMAETLSEYFESVRSSDIHAYGYGETIDFLKEPLGLEAPFDWVVTNPPFRLGEEFARRALRAATIGTAMLVRTNFIEGVGRYRRLFEQYRPAIIGQFVERVPILKGRVDPSASTATGYCWIVWTKEPVKRTELVWIPPCRRALERAGDYELPIARCHSDGDPLGGT